MLTKFEFAPSNPNKTIKDPEIRKFLISNVIFIDDFA